MVQYISNYVTELQLITQSIFRSLEDQLIESGTSFLPGDIIRILEVLRGT